MQEKLYRKKGMVEGAVGALMTLFLGIAVITLVLIFTGTLGGQVYSVAQPQIDALAGSVANETFTATNGTVVTFVNHNLGSSSLKVFNATPPYTQIGLDNFSINYVTGKITPIYDTVTEAGYNGASLAANYSFGDAQIQQYLKDGITSSFKAQKQTADYLPLVALAIIIGLVLVIVVGLGGLTGGGANRGAL